MQILFGESYPRLHPSDLADCRAMLRTGSRSFHAAAYFLPRRYRDPATALYAFCRQADDAIDEGAAPRRALSQLYRRLDALYNGAPEPYAADRALCAIALRSGLPKALPAALLEGFAWDAEGRQYPNLSSVLAYSARVAGAVGVMMTVLMGVRDANVLARAADMGVAMQLTNIARDVGEDARAGRLYLPEDWLREAGIDPVAFLAEPRFSPALGSVIARLLGVASELYDRADAGLRHLPAACRPGMFAARVLYAGIGDALLRAGCDSVSRRTVVSARGKLRVLLRLPRVAMLDDTALTAPVLAENRFLVSAVTGHPAPEVTSLVEAEGKVSWMLALLQELDRRDRRGIPHRNRAA